MVSMVKIFELNCRNLVPQLQNFPERIVAEQLGKLLLSRIVLLDQTAQTKLLPIILKPKGLTIYFFFNFLNFFIIIIENVFI